MLACDFNNIPFLRLLRAHQASPDLRSPGGWTAVDDARHAGGAIYRVVLEAEGLIPGTRLASS